MSEPHLRQTLPRDARIRSRGDFRRIFDGQLRASDRYVTVYATRSATVSARLGIAASRRLGNAVVRNQTKRLIREAFRRLRYELPEGSDWVIIPRPGAKLTVRDLEESIRQLARRLEPRLAELDLRQQEKGE